MMSAPPVTPPEVPVGTGRQVTMERGARGDHGQLALERLGRDHLLAEAGFSAEAVHNSEL